MSYDLDCAHENRLAVWTDLSGQGEPLCTRQLREQCQDCGRLLPQSLPHRRATSVTPNVNKDTLGAWNAGRTAWWDESAIAKREEQERRDAEWRAAYDAYIISDAWRLMRAKILKRDAYLCQGCLVSPATQVHHHSYSHMGREFGWQLTAVCEACHDRFHNREDAA